MVATHQQMEPLCKHKGPRDHRNSEPTCIVSGCVNFSGYTPLIHVQCVECQYIRRGQDYSRMFLHAGARPRCKLLSPGLACPLIKFFLSMGRFNLGSLKNCRRKDITRQWTCSVDGKLQVNFLQRQLRERTQATAAKGRAALHEEIQSRDTSLE